MKDLNSITEKIIKCAFTVSNALGPGFLEKVYENAMVIELKKSGLDVKQQHPVQVHYDGQIVGDYISDLFVEDNIIVELKTAKNIDTVHKAQLINYLKAADKRVGLILNFSQPKIEVKRIVNQFK